MKNNYWWLLLGLLLCVAPEAEAQKYLTHNGLTTFFSTSIIEDIEARSDQVSALVDLQTSQIAFSIPVKSFQFARTLMQEHFNENYMESGRFPKSSFTGKLADLNANALLKGGSQRVTVEGDLTIHGITKHITVPGALEMQKGSLLVHAFFSVAPADYGIEIPLLVRENIAKIVSIKVALSCDPISQLTLSKP